VSAALFRLLLLPEMQEQRFPEHEMRSKGSMSNPSSLPQRRLTTVVGCEPKNSRQAVAFPDIWGA